MRRMTLSTDAATVIKMHGIILTAKSFNFCFSVLFLPDNMLNKSKDIKNEPADVIINAADKRIDGTKIIIR